MIALSVAKLIFFFAGKRNFSLNKAKKENKILGESLDQIRRLELREKARNVFVMSLRLSVHKFLSISLGFSRFFRSYFVVPNFWSLRNLIKQLFHSRLLDMRLVIANSALRASLAIYHLISNARSWNNF